MKDILVGYEIGTGEPINVEATHMVVTGITNQSGKTTLLEGMASRANGFRFLVFKTKPHEQQFVTANEVKPFFRERTDWEYVAGILEASRNERMKFERFWIMRASKGADSLRIVDKNCVNLMEDEKEGGLAYSMYYQLHEYFKNILPELEGWNLGDNFPVLAEGINVMDLGEMSDGVQMLIIESCLAHILKNEKRLITLIPELWKFSPEGKRSPVKEHLDRLIRQGAAGKNFVWFDSQDMANVDKAPLKQCYTWVCLPPGQLIRTENGWKPIELIKEGESVLTHSGQFRHVTKAMSREYEGDIVEVRAYGHFATLRLTPEHPILASQVMLRDKNIWYYTSRVSGNRIQHIKQLTRPSVRWLNAGDISTENVLLTPRLKLKIEDHPPPILKPRLKGRWKRYGPSIPMSKDLFVLFGWYLAEGFVHDRYITFTLGSSKTELMYAGEICAAAKSLSFNATLDIHNGQIRVRLFGNSLAEFVTHNFGQYAYGKKIPAWALAQPKENLDALLSSYTKGDGHLHRGQDYTVSTVSYELAHGIRDVCLALGFPAWIRVIEDGQQRFPNGHISRIRRKYILGYSRNQERAQFRTRKGRLGIDDDYEYLRIKSVRRAKYSGPVYNLAVEGDESYTTEAFVVHNCGLQTERNEIKHTLDQINVPKKAKPTTDQVASLSLGQFYLSTPKGVKHFYAAPIWLPAEKAIQVAKGELASDQKEISDFKESYESEVQALHKENLSWDRTTKLAQRSQRKHENQELELENTLGKESMQLLNERFATKIDLTSYINDQRRNAISREEFNTLRDSVTTLSAKIGDLQRTTAQQGEALRKLEERKATTVSSSQLQIDDSQILVQITDHKDPHPLSTKNLEGKIAYTVYKILEGKASLPWEIAKAAADTRGWAINPKNFKRDCGGLLESGVLVMTDDGHYKVPKEIDVKFSEGQTN